MLFESLDKIKTNSLLSAILLSALGVIILICPEAYISLLTLAAGYVLVVVSIIMILNFLSGNKSLMENIKFVGALIVGIVGLCVLIFKDDVIHVLAWTFSFLLVLDGARTLYHSLTFVRCSQRSGWWILTILSVILIAIGILVFVNPFWNTPSKLGKVIGWAILFSAVVSAIRLVWTWPIRKNEGGEENE